MEQDGRGARAVRFHDRIRIERIQGITRVPMHLDLTSLGGVEAVKMLLKQRGGCWGSGRMEMCRRSRAAARQRGDADAHGEGATRSHGAETVNAMRWGRVVARARR